MQFYSMATIMMAMAIGLTLATGAHPGFTEKTFTLSNGSIGTAYLRSDFVHTTATQRQSVGVHAHSKKPPPPSMTAVDKRWSADFHPGEWEMYCEKVSMDDKTDRDSATADDCQELWAVFNETPGYWSIRDWNNGGFEMLAWYETCIVALSRTDDDYKNGAWFVFFFPLPPFCFPATFSSDKEEERKRICLLPTNKTNFVKSLQDRQR